MNKILNLLKTLASNFSIKNKSPEEKKTVYLLWCWCAFAFSLLLLFFSIIVRSDFIEPFFLLTFIIFLALFIYTFIVFSSRAKKKEIKKSATAINTTDSVYQLVEGEEVIFELNIEEPSRSDESSPAEAILNIAENIPIIGNLLGSQSGAAGVLVITNMRCFITSYPEEQSCCGFGRSKGFFWSFPREALNGSNSFEFSSKTICCCGCNSVTITLGLSIGKGDDFTISFETNDIETREQAEMVLAKFHQLSQQTR